MGDLTSNPIAYSPDCSEASCDDLPIRADHNTRSRSTIRNYHVDDWQIFVGLVHGKSRAMVLGLGVTGYQTKLFFFRTLEWVVMDMCLWECTCLHAWPEIALRGMPAYSWYRLCTLALCQFGQVVEGWMNFVLSETHQSSHWMHSFLPSAYFICAEKRLLVIAYRHLTIGNDEGHHCEAVRSDLIRTIGVRRRNVKERIVAGLSS